MPHHGVEYLPGTLGLIGPDEQRGVAAQRVEEQALVRVGRLLRRTGVRTVFVHVWDPSERVYTNGRAEPQYQPDPSGRTLLEALAVATGGGVFAEAEAAAAGRAARELLGDGPTQAEGVREARSGLAAYLAFAAFLPVGLLLLRVER